MSPHTPSLCIIGLGNLICTDDGVGIRAIEHLRQTRETPHGVHLVDGGTQGLALMPTLVDAEQVILIDAVAGSGPPGTLIRLEGADVLHDLSARLSVHQVGVGDLLGALSFAGGGPHILVVHGVVPGSIELSTELTPRVARALPELCEAVIQEAVRLGFSGWAHREVEPAAAEDPALREVRVG